ncbi:MAG: hypothetical protein AAF466_11415 [Bacteroidota bacterium]
MDSDSLLSNPFVLIFGGMALLLILYFWSRANTNRTRERRRRSFRRNYYERKKEMADQQPTKDPEPKE